MPEVEADSRRVDAHSGGGEPLHQDVTYEAQEPLRVGVVMGMAQAREVVDVGV